MNLSPSDYAAWWGAAVASGVGLWDVWKWRRERPGFALKVHLPTFTEYEKSGDFLSVRIEVLNGQAPTSVRSVALRHFKTQWHRLFGRPDRITQVLPDELPKKLEPADVWTFAFQEGDVLYHGDIIDGVLLVDVYGSHKTRPVSARLCFKKEEPNQTSDATPEPAPGAVSSAHQG